MEQVSSAVQFIFVFTLLAGGMVLYSALMTAFDERRYELSVMRALGCATPPVAPVFACRTPCGWAAIAGLIAAFGASALGQLLAQPDISDGDCRLTSGYRSSPPFQVLYLPLQSAGWR
jgi:putative ABC transport system permease protein